MAFLWFIFLAVLLTGYAILDGFDLGVGILHPFVTRTDHERRIVMNRIGPSWDGNAGYAFFSSSCRIAAFVFLFITAYYSAVSILGAGQ